MHYNDLVPGLLDELEATVKKLRVALAADPSACIQGVVTDVLESLPYPYRAGELNEALRRALPGIVTARIHTQMRKMGYTQHRDLRGLLWMVAGTASLPSA